MPKQKRAHKGRWRKLDLKDVEDKQEAARQKATFKGRGDAGDLFSFDTKGSTAGLSRSIRKAITKDPTGSGKKPMTHVQKLQMAKFAGEKRTKVAKVAKAKDHEDPWGVDKPVKVNHAYPVCRTSDNRPEKAPKTLAQKASVSPAVLPPQAGHSINPRTEDHEAVITKAAEGEFEILRQDERQRRRNRPMTHALQDAYGKEVVASMSDAEKLKKFLNLARAKAKTDGIDEAKAIADAHADALVEEEEAELELPDKRPTKPKTTAQRNKQLRNKVIGDVESAERKQKKLDKSIGEVGRVKKDQTKKALAEKAEREKVAKEKAVRKELERKGDTVTAKRIGKNTFRPSPLEVVYDADERKTMREAAKVSAINTCTDMYYRRNMLEATPENSRANARRVMKRVRKATVKKRYVDPLMRDSTMLL